MKYLKTKAFWEAAAFRCIRTFCQVFLATEASARFIEDVNWHYTISASLMAALFSLLTSIITGLPEAEGDEK